MLRPKSVISVYIIYLFLYAFFRNWYIYLLINLFILKVLSFVKIYSKFLIHVFLYRAYVCHLYCSRPYNMQFKILCKELIFLNFYWKFTFKYSANKTSKQNSFNYKIKLMSKVMTCFFDLENRYSWKHNFTKLTGHCTL